MERDDDYVFGVSYYDYNNKEHSMFRLAVPVERVRGHFPIANALPLQFVFRANDVYLLSPRREVIKCREFASDSPEALHDANFVLFEESFPVNINKLKNILESKYGMKIRI